MLKKKKNCCALSRIFVEFVQKIKNTKIQIRRLSDQEPVETGMSPALGQEPPDWKIAKIGNRVPGTKHSWSPHTGIYVHVSCEFNRFLITYYLNGTSYRYFFAKFKIMVRYTTNMLPNILRPPKFSRIQLNIIFYYVNTPSFTPCTFCLVPGWYLYIR